MDIYKVIGIMSGTSLDGLDIAYCLFIYDKKWIFQIEKAITIPYDETWKNKLKSLDLASGENLLLTHKDFGKFIGKMVNGFCYEHKIEPDFISSHGHTVFHQPQNQLTWQIGDGHAIFSETNVPVIYDFRSLDVALGGQGAPLVPVGDRLLFSGYDYCLNIGGIANISFEKGTKRFAYDICPANMVLNNLANRLGKEYDDKGTISRKGKSSYKLLRKFENLDFYAKPYPKSLGKEWVDSVFKPCLDSVGLSEQDLLATTTEHIAKQVSESILRKNHNVKLLITGGGTYNDFLIERIKALSGCQIVIPDDKLIQYKEALIFAFLGVLKWRNEINCLSSVTGSLRDSSSGHIIK